MKHKYIEFSEEKSFKIRARFFLVCAIRVRRVLFLDEQCSALQFFKISGSPPQEVLTEEPELRMALSDIQLICMGACSRILQESLAHMNGSLYRTDSIEQSRRCFSLIGTDGTLHVEVRPTNMQRSEERRAAQQVTEAVSRTLHRLRCRMPSSNLLPVESFGEAISLPGAVGGDV